MTQRDWDKELAKIDRQLASMPDDELTAASPPVPATGMPRGAGATAVRQAPTVAPVTGPVVSRTAKAWTYTKLAIAVTGAVGIWIWPWAARCGLPLAGLVGTAGLVSVLGLWSARGTWRHRMGLAHVVSLLAVVSALVLGAREVLPRVGYAQPTFDRPDRWACQAVPPETVSVSPTPPAQPMSGPGRVVPPSRS